MKKCCLLRSMYGIFTYTTATNPKKKTGPSFVGKERPYKKSIWAWKMGFVQDEKVLGGGFKYCFVSPRKLGKRFPF